MDILDIDETLDIDDLTDEYAVMMVCKTPPTRPVMFKPFQLLLPVPVYELLSVSSPWSILSGYPCGAAKDREGRVQLIGIVTGGTTNSVALTLPEGYRPPRAIDQPLASQGGYAGAYLTTNGKLWIIYSGAGWISLDSISYHVDYLWHSEG